MRLITRQDISISALFLATKLNETPIRLRDLINTYIFLNARIRHLLSLPVDLDLSSARSFVQPRNADEGDGRTGAGSVNAKGKAKEEDVWDGFKFQVPGFHDEVFWEWKDAITTGEMQILKRLGFNMQVDLPYNHAINYLKILDLVFEPDVAQTVWAVLNDMCLTPAHALHPPHVLACASILLTTRLKRIALPKGWERLFDADHQDVWGVVGMVMVLWSDWGIGSGPGLGQREEHVGPDELQPNTAVESESSHYQKEKEDRWRTAWILSSGGRRSVRRWLDERAARTSRSADNPR